jgi:peroxiredoxin
MHIRNTLELALLITLLSCANGWSAEIEIGAEGPDFSAVGIDDEEFSLDSVKDAKLIVLCFTCNGCPWARAYEERMIEFAKVYEAKGVPLIGINSNNREETLDDMKQHATDAGINFPYVFDESGDVARAYGAKVTPHFFVLDKDRKVAYRGAFDSGEREPEHGYLVPAVEALLEGKTPETQSTNARGCTIKLKLAAQN